MRTMILFSGDPRSHCVSAENNAFVVSTPLEAIVRLESRSSIATVVLAGSFATNPEFGEFLAETYPFLQIARES